MKKEKFNFPPWGWIYVFFFVVFSMNGVMVYLANTTWNGLSTENAYEKGLKHNDFLLQSEQQKKLGWQITAHWENETQNLRLDLIDSNGVFIDKAKVKAILFRPTTQGHDQKIELFHIGGGAYQSKATKPLLKGQWQARGEIRLNDHKAQFRHHFMVK